MIKKVIVTSVLAFSLLVGGTTAMAVSSPITVKTPAGTDITIDANSTAKPITKKIVKTTSTNKKKKTVSKTKKRVKKVSTQTTTAPVTIN